MSLSSKYSDEELLKLVIFGNNEAFATLVKKHVTNLYFTSFKLVRSKEVAEDIVQECFLKLWQFPQKFDHKKNVKFVTWFSRVVKNRSLDYLKKHKEVFLGDDFEQEDESKNQLEIMEEKFDKDILENAMKKLKENQRQAIDLSFFKHRKNQESAKIMGLSLKAFQSLLIRSKESLKVILKRT
mgnify:CR=1 FL=1